MKSVHIGNKVYLNADDILCVCPPDRLPKITLSEALDVAANKPRSAIITRSGTVFLADVSVDTALNRAGKKEA